MMGVVIAMGGAVRPDGAALGAFYQRSGGAEGCISILPTASRLADAGLDYVAALQKLGLRQPAHILPVRQREDAGRPEIIAALRESTGIFMTGGDQLRLSAVIGGTPLHQEILAAYQRGAVIAGTSAGTAVLSSVMIAYGRGGALPLSQMMHFSPGLGLVPGIIFDQHFRQRNRLGRLIYAVASNPEMLGAGVDENTAAIVENGLLTVAGAGAVTIVDGSSIAASNVAEVGGNQPVAVSEVTLHILTHDSTFDLATRKARIGQNSLIRMDLQAIPITGLSFASGSL